MKRLLVVALALGLGVASVSTAAAAGEPARKRRTVTGGYGAYPAPVTGCNSALGSFSCLAVRAHRTERFFTADVRDAHGLPVYVEVYGRHGRLVTSFCGRTSHPVGFPAGWELRFYVGLPVWGVQIACPQHSVKTTGTLRVTLSNLP